MKAPHICGGILKCGFQRGNYRCGGHRVDLVEKWRPAHHSVGGADHRVLIQNFPLELNLSHPPRPGLIRPIILTYCPEYSGLLRPLTPREFH
ncbi:unnamed protein product [Merluccius merluccius]